MMNNYIILEDVQALVGLIKEKVKEKFPDFVCSGNAVTLEKVKLLLTSTKPVFAFVEMSKNIESIGALVEILDRVNINVIFLSLHTSYCYYYMNAQMFSRITLGMQEPTPPIATPSLLAKIAIPTLEGYDFVETKDIIYCQAQNNYSFLYLTDGSKVILSKPLKYAYENILPMMHFFKIHRSTVINLTHLNRYIKKRGKVEMSNGAVLEVSPSRKEAFLDLFVLPQHREDAEKPSSLTENALSHIK